LVGQRTFVHCARLWNLGNFFCQLRGNQAISTGTMLSGGSREPVLSKSAAQTEQFSECLFLPPHSNSRGVGDFPLFSALRGCRSLEQIIKDSAARLSEIVHYPLFKMSFPGMPGGGAAATGAGGGNTSGMSDQEAAMVKAVSQASQTKFCDLNLIRHDRRCKELWKVVLSRLCFQVVWALPLVELSGCLCLV